MSFDGIEGKIQKILMPTIKTGAADKRDQVIADLEEKLISSKDGRCEERFWWIFGTSSTAVYGFCFFAPWGLCTVIIPLHLVVIIALAEKLGVDYAVVHLNRFYYTLQSKFGSQKSTDDS